MVGGGICVSPLEALGWVLECISITTLLPRVIHHLSLSSCAATLSKSWQPLSGPDESHSVLLLSSLHSALSHHDYSRPLDLAYQC